MTTELQRAYFGEHDPDVLLRRIAKELSETRDPMLTHIYAMAAARIGEIKGALDMEAMVDAFADEYEQRRKTR